MKRYYCKICGDLLDFSNPTGRYGSYRCKKYHYKLFSNSKGKLNLEEYQINDYTIDSFADNDFFEIFIGLNDSEIKVPKFDINPQNIEQVKNKLNIRNRNLKKQISKAPGNHSRGTNKP